MKISNMTTEEQVTKLEEMGPEGFIQALKNEDTDKNIFDIYAKVRSAKAKKFQESHTREEQIDIAENRTAEITKNSHRGTYHGNSIYDPKAGSEEECYS